VQTDGIFYGVIFGLKALHTVHSPSFCLHNAWLIK